MFRLPGNNPGAFAKGGDGAELGSRDRSACRPGYQALLAELDTKHRAGFGTPQEFGFLDIFLPFINPTIENRAYRRVLTPATFSTLVGRHEGFAVVHDKLGERRGANEVLIFGRMRCLSRVPGGWKW